MKYDLIQEVKNQIDYIEEVQKFNPYHGADGRFASANGATSFTFRTKDPKKQYMADMAVAREKERHAAAIANPTNDPDTIVGVKRGEPMTHEQANQGNVNPRYGQSYDYSRNCQSCVVAYEARLRGYNVEAKGKDGYNSIQNSLSRDSSIAWKDPVTGKQAVRLINDPKIRTSKQIHKWVDENIKEGERYAFAHGWKGTKGYMGHVISATKEGGKLKLYDPQDGKSYTGDRVAEYMGQVKGTCNIGGSTLGRLRLTRIDNMQIDPSVANAVLRGAGQ